MVSDGGIVGDRMLGYHRERARGGVGAGIVEGAAVRPTTITFPQYLLAHDPSIVPSLARLADALHEHDTRVFLQLAHSGSLENRCRLAVEVVRRVRAVLPDHVVGIRSAGPTWSKGASSPTTARRSRRSSPGPPSPTTCT